MKKLFFAFILSVSILLQACSGGETRHIDRVDRFVAGYSAMKADARAAGVDSLYPQLRSLVRNYAYDTPDDKILLWLSESDATRYFQPPVDSVYPDLDYLEKDLDGFFRNAAKNGLDFPEMSFAAVTWGRSEPIVRDSTVVLIALNHFLGADFPGDSHREMYRRLYRTPRSLPYTLARVLICTQYPKVDSDDATLLSWMLYEGAVTEAVLRLLPDSDPALAFEFTPEQLKFADANTRAMFNDLAANGDLYDKSPFTADRYVGPAPSTPLLGGQAPGRSGRYLGYMIVKAYLKSHPDASLSYLLSPGFYDNPKSLIESGF